MIVVALLASPMLVGFTWLAVAPHLTKVQRERVVTGFLVALLVILAVLLIVL